MTQVSQSIYDPTLFTCPTSEYLGRDLGGERGQLAALAAHNAAEKPGQGIQMSGHIACGLTWVTLFQGLTYGTIAVKVVTHPMHLLIRFQSPLDGV